MAHPTHRRRTLVSGAVGAGAMLVFVIVLGVLVGNSVAASAAKPHSTSPPTISGTPQEGQTLTGDRGQWANNPTDFNYFWMRCEKSGGSCSNITGAHELTYKLTSPDVGNTLRFRVQASNGDGTTNATSVPTAVITAAASPPPPPAPPAPPATGCPSGSGGINVSQVSAPARLLIDQIQFSPSVVNQGTQQIVARFHVTACGRPVEGALVYATAVPFNQLSIPNEQPSGSDGWATLTFTRLNGFPVSPHQSLIAMFARARKGGENLLSGISTRRLVSVRVNLNS
jgi:hypothetical protein